MKQNFWAQGIKFACQGSGNCCTSRGEYGFVYLTKADRSKLAMFLKIPLTEFEKKYCERTGKFWHLKEYKANPDCQFLVDKKCSVYQARPTQCRTWPFWPEVMNAKTWSEEVRGFCPGVGKGDLIPLKTINATMKEQLESENELRAEAESD